eukprot:scaffold1954_cov63-Phaeocystis_antarctica.AAC.1
MYSRAHAGLALSFGRRRYVTPVIHPSSGFSCYCCYCPTKSAVYPEYRFNPSSKAKRNYVNRPFLQPQIVSRKRRTVRSRDRAAACASLPPLPKAAAAAKDPSGRGGEAHDEEERDT